MRELVSIETTDDRSEPQSGFLRVKRLVMRNHYADGSTSAEYPCDIVSRTHTDAVAIVLYDQDEAGRVRVALKTGVRPPIYLRKDKTLIHPDDATWLLLPEIVAGMLEPGDAGEGGIERRAAAECLEEAGVTVAPQAIERLGGPLFASPGITDELVHYRAVKAPLDDRVDPTGDGSVMEEAGHVVLMDLDEAITRCRDGSLPDVKTEVALVRLRDQLRDEG